MFKCFSELEGFVGYGSSKPRFVFLGIEEYGDGSESSFRTRCASFTQPLFDKDKAWDLLGLKPDTAPVPVWKFCAMVVAALRELDNEHTTWQLEYERLGTLSGDTLLANLFPIPKPGTGYWSREYEGWFGFSSSRRLYTGIWPRRKRLSPSPRKELLQSVILNGLRSDSVMVCYGKSAWPYYSDLLGIRRWEQADREGVEKAATSTGLRVVRTGFPFNKRSKSRVDEDDVPSIIKALSQ